MNTSHDDYTSMYAEPFRDSDPLKQKFELELAYRLRKFSDRWKIASDAEKKILLTEMAAVERQTELEFGLAKPEPKPQPSLANKIRIK